MNENSISLFTAGIFFYCNFSSLNVSQAWNCNSSSAASRTQVKLCVYRLLKFTVTLKLYRFPELWNLFWGAKEMWDETSWLKVTHTHTHCKECSSYCFISAESRKLISRLSPSNSYWMNSLWGILLKPPTHLTEKNQLLGNATPRVCVCARLLLSLWGLVWVETGAVETILQSEDIFGRCRIFLEEWTFMEQGMCVFVKSRKLWKLHEFWISGEKNKVFKHSYDLLQFRGKCTFHSALSGEEFT